MGLCAECNNRTARWESEYRAWKEPLHYAIHARDARAGQRISASIEAADPGAFVRVLWGWMFALDAKLLTGWPELAAAVLSGEPTAAPRGLRVLLAATPSPWIAAVRPIRAVWTGQGWDPDAANQPRVAVSAPPFEAILVVDGTNPAPGFLDTEKWLADRAGDRRRVELELPLVDTVNDEDVARMQAGVDLSA